MRNFYPESVSDEPEARRFFAVSRCRARDQNTRRAKRTIRQALARGELNIGNYNSNFIKKFDANHRHKKFYLLFFTTIAVVLLLILVVAILTSCTLDHQKRPTIYQVQLPLRLGPYLANELYPSYLGHMRVLRNNGRCNGLHFHGNIAHHKNVGANHKASHIR